MMARILPDMPQARDGRARLSLEGQVNLVTVPMIRTRLLGWAKKRATQELSIDLSRVTQLDTAGMAMLVEVWRYLVRRGGKLRLSGLSENAGRLLHLAGLDQILTIEDRAQ